MDKLESIPSITRLSNYTIRVLGQNPGKFALQGTNTYLVGRHNPYVLIDTGEGRSAYLPILESALRETASIKNPDQPDISDIVITHKHMDHYNGLPGILPLLKKLWTVRNPNTPINAYIPPRLHKFPLSSTEIGLRNMLNSLSKDEYTPSPSGSQCHDISETEPLAITFDSTETTAEQSALQFIHTPGHTVDSIAIYFPIDEALFTADTVLGYGSTIFEDLRTYMLSLQKMYDFRLPLIDEKPKYHQLYPGHGPVVKNGPTNIFTYIKHRQKRDDQIMSVLKQSPPEGEPWTTWSIVQIIYKDYTENLWEPAALTLDMHLRKLEQEGKVEALGGVGKDVMWEAL